MDPFRGQGALVTGAGSGIGRALCLELARRGARVLATDVDAARAQVVAAEAVARGGRAEAAALDVTRAEDVAALVEREAANGRLDLLFNNAGIGIVGEVRDHTLADWRRTLDVNLMGVVHGVQAAYPLMARRRAGHIVNTASLAGLVAAPGLALYSAAKHAVVGLSMALRVEAAALGVRVSVVCPGLVKTGIVDAGHYVNVDAPRVKEMLPRRMMTAENCARAVLGGVARNRGLIVVGADAALLWRLYRLYPTAFEPWGRRLVRQLRQARRPDTTH